MCRDDFFARFTKKMKRWKSKMEQKTGVRMLERGEHRK